MKNQAKIRTPLIVFMIAIMVIITVVSMYSVPAQAANNKKITVTIGGKKYTATLKDNKTAKEFMSYMPKSFKMSKLNGNEIYKYTDFTLPTNEKRVSKIHKGDIMLYGDNCIVIFYKTFKTNYKYTKIGRLDNVKGLKKAVSKKKVRVKFKVK